MNGGGGKAGKKESSNGHGGKAGKKESSNGHGGSTGKKKNKKGSNMKPGINRNGTEKLVGGVVTERINVSKEEKDKFKRKWRKYWQEKNNIKENNNIKDEIYS